ncbi:hypothetical protein BDAP_000785 [Binucleata daphniae]
MNEIKHKIFKGGIFGVLVKTITFDEFTNIYLDDCYEIIDDCTKKKLEKEFTANAVFLSTKELHEEKYTNTSMLELYNILQHHYVKINLVAWKIIATRNLYNFKNQDYFLVFDYFVRMKTFVNVKEYKKTLSESVKKSFSKFIDKMVKNRVLVQNEKDKNMYRYVMLDEINDENNKQKTNITENNDTNIARNTQKFDTTLQTFTNPEKYMKQVKDMLICNKNGILTSQVAAELDITKKHAYRLIEKTIKNNKEYSFLTEVEGKVTRKRFFNTKYMQGYKDKLTAAYTNKPVILASDRIEAIKILVDKYRIVETGKDIYQEFSSMIKSKYVTDGKNFRKLAVKAGCTLTRHYIGDSIVNYLVCAKDVSKEEIEKYKQTKKRVIETKPKKMIEHKLYETFVSFDLFVATDNGYIISDKKRKIYYCKVLYEQIHKIISKKEEKYVIHIKQLEEILLLYVNKQYDSFVEQCYNNEDMLKYLHSQIIEQNNIADLCKIVYYPYYLEEHSVKNVMYLRETNEVKKMENTKKMLKHTLNEIKQSNYSNSDVLHLSKYFTADKLAQTNINQAHKIYGVEHNKRMQFYDDVCKFNDTTDLQQILSYIDSNFVGREYEAMYNRLLAYRKKLAKKHKFFDRENAVPKRLHVMYETIKNEFLTKHKIKVKEIEHYNHTNKDCDDFVLKNCNKTDNKKVLQYLIKDNIIIQEHKYYKLKKSITKKINEHNVNTIFPAKYMHRIEIDNKDKYYKMYWPLIHFILIQSGTLKLEVLLQKIQIMNKFELNKFV